MEDLGMTKICAKMVPRLLNEGQKKRRVQVCQDKSCKSGRAFRVGFGPKVGKNFGLNSGLRRAFCLRCTKT